MRENRMSGSEGGEAGQNRPSLPLSVISRPNCFLKGFGRYRGLHELSNRRNPLTVLTLYRAFTGFDTGGQY